MNKTNLSNAAANLRESRRRLEDISRSRLDNETKEKARRSYRNMLVGGLAGGFGMAFLIVLGIFFLPLEGIAGAIYPIAAGLLVTGVIIAIMVPAGQNFRRAAKIVNLGFDGLSPQEIAFLKPDAADRRRMRGLVWKEAFFTLLMILELLFFLFLSAGTDSKLWLIPGIVLAFFPVLWMDSCQAERHRLASGFYKRPIPWQCPCCKGTLTIPRHIIPGLPVDPAGNKVISCPGCHHPVVLDTLSDWYRKGK